MSWYVLPRSALGQHARVLPAVVLDEEPVANIHAVAVDGHKFPPLRRVEQGSSAESASPGTGTARNYSRICHQHRQAVGAVVSGRGKTVCRRALGSRIGRRGIVGGRKLQQPRGTPANRKPRRWRRARSGTAPFPGSASLDQYFNAASNIWKVPSTLVTTNCEGLSMERSTRCHGRRSSPPPLARCSAKARRPPRPIGDVALDKNVVRIAADRLKLNQGRRRKLGSRN